jgi:hypothetical protein
MATTLALLAAGLPAFASVRYVDLNSANPTPPFTNWATAATNIQDAIDIADAGEEIVVTNGVYQTGGRAVLFTTMTNRVMVDKPLAVRSVNGPQVTIIQGYQLPGTTDGDGAIRCVYLTNGASLSGFTLTNGGTRAAGDMEMENFGGGLWCGSSSAIVSNCVVAGNSAYLAGGGAYQGTLKNCTLSGNSAPDGGGAAVSTLHHCTLNGNYAQDAGGGAVESTLNNCTLSGNSAPDGGGASGGTLNNCTLTGNSATNSGGGASQSTMNNCTLTGNSASNSGGGAFQCALNNCIVYYNAASTDANYAGSSTLNYCCTTPSPGSGVGNLDVEPQLASASHLSTDSLCLGRGTHAAVTGVDIDGEPWANPPAMGCDQYYSGSVTGALAVALLASYSNVAPGFSVDFQALISGRVSASRWEFSDGTVVSNRPYAAHAWNAAGDYPVLLRAYNETYPAGVTATTMVHVVAEVHYVALDSASPAAPYSSWATAATNIQDAVDAAAVPGALVLVTNGVYQAGGRPVSGTLTNRVAVDKPLAVRSVNGPGLTIIRGYQVPVTTNGAIRCVYLTNGASLSGFTLTIGATRSAGDVTREQSGGGLWCESTSAIVSNCVISGNSAANSGGGAYQGTLSNCIVNSNTSQFYGGGVYSGTLDNCTLSGNYAQSGGGAYGGALNNCTLSGNSAANYGGGAAGSTLNTCMLNGNYAQSGGGAGGGTLNTCTLTGNSAQFGGGAYGGGGTSCILNNCALTGNHAQDGGGAYIWTGYYFPYGGTLNHCTVTGNVADSSGGGVYGGGYYNCPINNCTLTDNSAEFGGGAFLGSLSNCTVTGNWANWAGGVYSGTLSNCKLTDNWASWAGGASHSTLDNCTITGNAADYGGGAYYSSLNNCIDIFNTATEGANYWNSSLNYCCTTPRPTSGLGNITSDPLFADYAGGNLRLQSNSPCINSGLNAYAPAGPDLDGNPRIAGGTVDLGAYEFQSPGSTISYAWLQQYGLVPDASVDSTDSDGDGLNNWQEWIAGTVPTNALSTLRLLDPIKAVLGLTVSWQSVSNRTYFLERATNLVAAPPFSLLTSNIAGQAGTTSYTDTSAVGAERWFYRVGVSSP